MTDTDTDTDADAPPITLDQALTQRHAARHAVVDVDERQVKLVIFALGGQCFAFEGGQVREILSGAPVYPLPGCPASLEGVIHLRGDIESVIRLQDLLLAGQPSTPPHTNAGAIMLCQSADLRSGLRVDRVIDVVDIPISRISTPPATLPAHLQGLITGVLQWQDEPVGLLDLQRLLQDYTKSLV